MKLKRRFQFLSKRERKKIGFFTYHGGNMDIALATIFFLILPLIQLLELFLPLGPVGILTAITASNVIEVFFKALVGENCLGLGVMKFSLDIGVHCSAPYLY
jgi:hypothetical protein